MLHVLLVMTDQLRTLPFHALTLPPCRRPRQPPAPSTLPTPSRLLQHVAGCAPNVADRPLACGVEPSTLQRYIPPHVPLKGNV